MSGSGGNDSNVFSCRTSELSATNITNHEFWSLRAAVRQGGIPIALFESVVFIVALGWNLFIFITYILKHKLLKEPANILLFSVSITDILICLLVIPFPLIVAAAGEFIIGNSDIVRCVVCQIQGYFVMFLTELSVHLLAVLSIDRCILLSNPLRYKNMKRVWTTVVGVVIIWLLSSLLALPPAFGFGEWEFNRNFGLCLPRWTPFSNGIYMGVIMTLSLIPIIILAVTNVWTYKIVHHFLKKNLARKKSFRATKEGIKTEESTHRTQQGQLVKVFGALFIVNIASWTPLLIVTFILVAIGSDSIPEWVYIIGWFFYLLNPTVHPILESFFIKELRTRVNKARNNVGIQVRRASRTIIRMATFESFKDIPTMEDDDESEKSRNLFGLKKKGTSQSLNSTVSTYIGEESSQGSPTATTRANTVNNSGRFSDRDRRSGSPLESSHTHDKHITKNHLPADMRTSSSSPLPCIDELSQLETADISETAYQQQKISTSSLSGIGAKKKKNRHISITVPGEKDVYYADHNSRSVSPSSSNNSSNDSAILSQSDTENTFSTDVTVKADETAISLGEVKIDSGTAIEYFDL